MPLSLRITSEDHPRRCGENIQRFLDNVKRLRITPAGAGKTFDFQCYFGLY